MLEESQVHTNKVSQSIHIVAPIEADRAALEEVEGSTLAEQGDVTSTDAPRNTSISAGIETALIIIGLLCIFLFLPRDTGGDGWVRYQDLLTLLSHHTFYSPESRYSLVGPLFALPLLLVGRHFGHSYDWILVYNELVFACGLLVTYLLLKDRIDRGLLRKFFLLLIIASMFTAHLALFYGEVFTAICVGFSVLIACYVRFASPAAWFFVALGVVNTPASIVALGLMLLKRMLDAKRLRYLLVIAIAGIFIMAESYLRRGSFLASNYGNDHGVTTVMPYSGLPGFSYPFFFGLLSILFSFGKGLFFFAPGLLLPVRQILIKRQQSQLYQVYILWICFLAGLILVYSRWWAWYGGIFWGPRFFLIASLPASLALAIRLKYKNESSLAVNIFTFIVLCLSTWVGINGAVYQWGAAMTLPATCTKNHYALELLCYYTPELSTLWLPFVKIIALSLGQKLFMAFSLFVFAYLIVPLSLKIVLQLRDAAKIYSRMYLNPRLWRL
ncbi:MAG: hypothetical protein NVS2B12_00920 [Ktedonobacteraceae bacterium]